jgi:hypothetical protein
MTLDILLSDPHEHLFNTALSFVFEKKKIYDF